MNIYADCSFCGGNVVEAKVQKVCFWGDRLTAIIDNVPAGVCRQCGERYYKSQVLKQVEDILKTKRGFHPVTVPAAEFAEVA